MITRDKLIELLQDLPEGVMSPITEITLTGSEEREVLSRNEFRELAVVTPKTQVDLHLRLMVENDSSLISTWVMAVQR